jgi:hypothetical protein
VVDVHDPPGVALAKARREDLHEAREHHQLDLSRLEQPLDLREGPLLGISLEGDVVERHRKPLDILAGSLVVGDHASEVEYQLPGAPAVEQVGEAVRLAAHQDRHPFRHTAVADGELHLVPARERQEAVAELLDPERQRLGRDHVAHEEAAGAPVRVVAHLGEPAAPRGDQAADGGDQPHPVGAGDGQDVLAFSRVFHDRWSVPATCLLLNAPGFAVDSILSRRRSQAVPHVSRRD